MEKDRKESVKSNKRKELELRGSEEAGNRRGKKRSRILIEPRSVERRGKKGEERG